MLGNSGLYPLTAEQARRAAGEDTPFVLLRRRDKLWIMHNLGDRHCYRGFSNLI